VHRDDIRLAEQCLLVNKTGAGGPGLLGRVLTPGYHLHAERETALLSKLSASGSVTRAYTGASNGRRDRVRGQMVNSRAAWQIGWSGIAHSCGE
jgi:competence protein ComGC